MSIPSSIQNIIPQLNQELNTIEQQATEGTRRVQDLLSSFPDNLILIQFFATFSNTLLFVEIAKRRIQITINRLLVNDLTEDEITEIGEDLSAELGAVLEAKIRIEKILNRLRELL